jgi:hypothetical protein
MSDHILDSTKIKAFLSCPRRYYFEYVRNWRPDYPEKHLVFGQAWHAMLELAYIAKKDTSPLAWAQYKQSFLKIWRESFSESEELTLAPKNAESAFSALESYINLYKAEPYELLETEIGGSVLIGEHKYYYKIDAIIKDNMDNVHVLEHKTGSSEFGYWADQWYSSVQPIIYYLAGISIYGFDNFKSVIINGTFFKKSGNTHQRVVVKKDMTQLLDSLWHLNAYSLSIKENHRMLETLDKGAHLLKAFPKNTESCTKYNKLCPYFILCNHTGNPETIQEVPIGYVEKVWDPRAVEVKQTFTSELSLGKGK